MHGILAKMSLTYAQIHPLPTPLHPLESEPTINIHLAKMQKVVTKKRMRVLPLVEKKVN